MNSAGLPAPISVPFLPLTGGTVAATSNCSTRMETTSRRRPRNYGEGAFRQPSHLKKSLEPGRRSRHLHALHAERLGDAACVVLPPYKARRQMRFAAQHLIHFSVSGDSRAGSRLALGLSSRVASSAHLAGATPRMWEMGRRGAHAPHLFYLLGACAPRQRPVHRPSGVGGLIPYLRVQGPQTIRLHHALRSLPS